MLRRSSTSFDTCFVLDQIKIESFGRCKKDNLKVKKNISIFLILPMDRDRERERKQSSESFVGSCIREQSNYCTTNNSEKNSIHFGCPFLFYRPRCE